jgi:EAL domain-containing protein (putative c-di-GMP-specific phosphodiesterase class I)
MARLKREALALLGSQDRLVGDRAGLEAAFEAALDALAMAHQPIVRADGTVYGFEALLRGRTPALATPSALLDAAERLNQVERLGRQVRALVARNLPADDRLAFVNLHPLDLADPQLADPMAPLSGHARRVVLEVTERASLDRVTGLRGRVARLRELGYRIALDDLGAGYAGLSSLAALNPEVIKLDMSLVRGIDLDPVKRKLVASMVGVGHELGALVLAEGVETTQEHAALDGLGCDLLQGYLFGRPELVAA